MYVCILYKVKDVSLIIAILCPNQYDITQLKISTHKTFYKFILILYLKDSYVLPAI